VRIVPPNATVTIEFDTTGTDQPTACHVGTSVCDGL